MRRRMMLGVPVAISCGLLVNTAQARSSSVVNYSLARSFSAALRLLRVDKRYAVTEKDETAAYLLFDYPKPNGPKAFGAIELAELDTGVRVTVSIPTMPEYHARSLRDELLRKLRREYGAPKKARDRPKPPQDAEPPDAPPT